MNHIRFTIEDAAHIAYGKDAGRVIQGDCVRHEEAKEAYSERRAKVFNAAYSYAHVEAGDEFFTEAMENARNLMPAMREAYQSLDYAEIGVLMGAALERQRRLLAERETVRIMNE